MARLRVETLFISAALVPAALLAGAAVGPSLGPLAFGPDGRIAPWPG